MQQEKQAHLMERKHNKKRNKRTVEFKIGDLVSILIPRIDRGGSDMPRLPCQIVKINGEFYQLLTKYGLLNDHYMVSDLEPYNGLVMFDKTMTNKLSLREASKLAANRLKDLKAIELSCNCKSKCLSKHCSCFKNEQKCNSHCHLSVNEKDKSCENC